MVLQRPPFNEGPLQDNNAHLCPFTSTGIIHEVEISEVLGKSITGLVSAEEMNMKRPKLKPGGGKKNIFISKNLFFFGISGRSGN